MRSKAIAFQRSKLPNNPIDNPKLLLSIPIILLSPHQARNNHRTTLRLSFVFVRLCLVRLQTEFLCPLLRSPLITDLSLSWSTWAKKLKKKSVLEILNKIHISVFGKATALTTSMIKTLLRNKFILILPNQQYSRYLKAIMPQFLHMGKLELEKRTLWKVLNTMVVTLNEVSYQEAWRKFFSLSKCKPIIK